MNNIVRSHQFDAIYQSLPSLNIFELERLMDNIVILRREKLPSVLSSNETELLKKINGGAPPIIQKRYNFLLQKKNSNTLEDSEYQELLGLTSYIESLEVKRLEYLLELAKLRNLTLDEVLEQLQIKQSLYVV